VAILPIGAGAKQHGFHMPMGTDQIFADYFARALAKKIDALIWPTLTYGAYPAFISYAGSVSLSSETFQAVVTEIADALLVINIANPSEIPKFAEPFFLKFNARCLFRAVMSPDDLQNAGLEALGKT
jgi:hypothetical protein